MYQYYFQPSACALAEIYLYRINITPTSTEGRIIGRDDIIVIEPITILSYVYIISVSQRVSKDNGIGK